MEIGEQGRKEETDRPFPAPPLLHVRFSEQLPGPDHHLVPDAFPGELPLFLQQDLGFDGVMVLPIDELREGLEGVMFNFGVQEPDFSVT